MTTPTRGDVEIFRLRAGRALMLGVVAMGGVAWIVSLAGVVGGLAGGVPLALLTPRSARPRGPLAATVLGALLGAMLGSYYFGHGPMRGRLVGGVVATLAVAPWAFVLAFVLWARAHAPKPAPRGSGRPD
ncbi:MAG TPA: hypothetical protein VN848_00575 [Gemmatimonadales bacterium]|nr:hypothetical protein [Gemmatimonadales bacterium]